MFSSLLRNQGKTFSCMCGHMPSVHTCLCSLMYLRLDKRIHVSNRCFYIESLLDWNLSSHLHLFTLNVIYLLWWFTSTLANIAINILKNMYICQCRYTYKLGHRLNSGSYVWSKNYLFKAPPFPGQNSLQRVIIFGDTGKVRIFFFWFEISACIRTDCFKFS